MAFSTLSSINSIIKYPIVSVSSGLTPSIWFKFDSGSTYTSSSITNSGTVSGFSYTNDTANTSINTSTYKYGGGSLYSNKSSTVSTITGLTAPSSVSIAFWVNCATPSGLYRIIYFCNLNIYLWNNGGMNVILWCNNNWMNTWGDAMVSANTWTHLTLTVTSGGAWTIYLNGSSAKTGTYSSWSSQFSSVNTFALLHEYGYGGYLDDLRIFNNVVLRSDQVTAIYNNTTVPT